MILKTEQIKAVLFNNAIGVRELSRETGVDVSTISKLRKGDDTKFQNLTLATLEKVQRWIDEGNFRMSYDYSELIEDIEQDIFEGLAGDYLFIERGSYNEILDVCPVVEYYCNSSEIEDDIICEKVSTKVLLTELKQFNEL